MKEFEQKHSESSAKVSDLTNELAHLSETLQEVKRAMNEKGNSMTDTTPLVQTKQALAKLKGETKDFDLRIGVLVSEDVFDIHVSTQHNILESHLNNRTNQSHTLLQAQLHRANPQEHSPRHSDTDDFSFNEEN